MSLFIFPQHLLTHMLVIINFEFILELTILLDLSGHQSQFILGASLSCGSSFNLI